jgi:hypothetical protein
MITTIIERLQRFREDHGDFVSVIFVSISVPLCGIINFNRRLKKKAHHSMVGLKSQKILNQGDIRPTSLSTITTITDRFMNEKVFIA